MQASQLWRTALCCAVFAACLPATASPWSRLVPFKKVEAEPDNLYPITEENGPWMIMATTFTGDGAREQALKLVHELRRDYKLQAYTYQKTFDLSKGTQGRGVDRYGAPKKMQYRQSQISEIAVLVGNYPSVADEGAKKVLKKLKFATPEALKVKEGQKTSQSLGALRSIQSSIQRSMLPDGDERKNRGPMGNAFVTTNPLMPPEYFVPRGIDKLVIDMNKGVKYSLLECPSRYTVKVATFNGSIIIDQKVIKQLEEGVLVKKTNNRLEEAAEKAHAITEALRAKGVPAYEFHDRYSSIVTVGGFDSVGNPRGDGKIEINPAVHATMKTYGAATELDGKVGSPKVGEPRTIEVSLRINHERQSLTKVPFDVSPVPVEVPRRALSSDYSRTADLR